MLNDSWKKIISDISRATVRTFMIQSIKLEKKIEIALFRDHQD